MNYIEYILVKYISRNKEHEKLRRLAVESDEILSELKVSKEL